jgi:hypothetical protein
MYILNNWSIKDRESRNGRLRVHLSGKVFGNPRFPAGEIISTSAITRYRFETDSVVTRSGSEYRLGKPDGAGPSAKRKLVEMLDAVRSGDDSHEQRPAEACAEQTGLRM